jgi:hypothetical protein
MLCTPGTDYHTLDFDGQEAKRSTNTLLQSVGRVAKGLGQTESEKVWILFQGHTICRCIEANSTKKALGVFILHSHIDGHQVTVEILSGSGGALGFSWLSSTITEKK